MAQYSWKTA